MLGAKYWTKWAVQCTIANFLFLWSCCSAPDSLQWVCILPEKWLWIPKFSSKSSMLQSSCCHLAQRQGLHCHLPCHICISTCCIEAFQIIDSPWQPKKCFFKQVPFVYLQKYPVVHKGSGDDTYYLQLAHLFAAFFTPFSYRYLLFVLILFYLFLCKNSSETAHFFQNCLPSPRRKSSLLFFRDWIFPSFFFYHQGYKPWQQEKQNIYL